MQEELLQIVDQDRTGSLNEALLKKHTKCLSADEIDNLRWEDVEYLNIFGLDDLQFTDKFPDTPSGIYASEDRKWVLLFKQMKKQVWFAIDACGGALKHLSVTSVYLEELNLSRLTGLQLLSCHLNGNLRLCRVIGIRECRDLEVLVLKDLAVTGDVDISKMSKLKRLHLRLASRNKASDHCFTGYQNLESLEDVVIGGPLEESVLDVSGMTGLKSLFLRQNESLRDIKGIEELKQLEKLTLEETGIRRIPEGVRQLEKLRWLGLSRQTLDTLPDWIMELDLPFVLRTTSDRRGIYVRKAEILDMNMSIFSQPKEMIFQWFEARKAGNEVPLNEIKVVFLGDGGTGKSHTIDRLLRDGGKLKKHTDGSTPGIVIKDKTYLIDGREIQVHYWDFGGQEILHSMHRIFLTERTLYVVLINARDETPDARARYWLQNIKSFAPKAKVLLVLNRMDENPNASFNEVELRQKYENLSNIVKLSALVYDKKKFNREFRDVLLKEIQNTGYLDVTWPRHWIKVKRDLEQIESNYICAKEYRDICRKHGADNNWEELLEWFTDLGISYRCLLNFYTKDYVILKPNWITNALYIILFNRCRGAKNGLIPHESIGILLSEEAEQQSKILRVLPGVYYESKDMNYVLNVFHKTLLSFDAGNGREFIPMLCDPNSDPVAREYEEDEKTLEFQMEFDYLPSNLLYNLMVDRKEELQINHVWRTGALFVKKGTGFSAVVKIDGEMLRFFIRSTEKMDHPKDYLTVLRDHVDRIWKRMELPRPTMKLVYKSNGSRDYFDYNALLKMYHVHGAVRTYSKALDTMIEISHILDQSAPTETEEQKRLLNEVLRACEHIQGTELYRSSSEDARNTRIRDDLRGEGYFVSDQTQQGNSSSGRNPGELDIEVRTTDGRPWTIIECLRVRNAEKLVWNAHLKKLLDDYNAHGVQFVFLLTYVDCEKEKFGRICTTFENHMKGYSTDRFTYVPDSFEKLNPVVVKNINYTRTVKCQYTCGDYKPTVYHIFVQIDKK